VNGNPHSPGITFVQYGLPDLPTDRGDVHAHVLRSFVAAAAVTAAVVTGGIATAAPAAAAPRDKPIPGVPVYGNVLNTFGDHDYCRGGIALRYTSPKRGVVRLTMTSNGFTGNGAGWRKNPRCGVLIGVNNSNGLFTVSEKFFPATFGAKRGEKLVKDIVTGSGFREIGVASYARNTPVRVVQSFGVGLFGIIP